MRILILLAVTALAGVVYSERCTDTAACIKQGVTVCEQNSTLICATTVQMCVCIMLPVDNAEHCLDKTDCTKCTGMTEPDCYDRRCRCTFAAGGALLG